ncbi:MAG: HAMP domain-containing sensor histidine kinase [Myxococcota bacterium]
MPEDRFEDRFAWITMSAGAVASLMVAVGITLTEPGHPAVPGVVLGLTGCIASLTLRGLRWPWVADRLYLMMCAMGVGWASSAQPTLESPGAAALSWVLLGIFGSILLSTFEMTLLGVACTWGIGFVSLRTFHLLPPDLGQGMVVAIVFVPTAFLVLSVIARDFRRRLHRVAAAEARATEALRTQERFMAVMSHELRTPLNVILGYAELLIEEYPDAQPDLDRIHRAGTLLLGQINAVLDLSKIEAGQMEIHLEPIRIAVMLRQLALDHRPLAEKHGNALVVRGDESLRIISDRGKLGQILRNLITNANKFTEGGVVALTAEADGSGVALAVKDEGIGIPEADLPSLFEPFVQVDGSHTRRFDGTGLGLTIVREFVQLLGGTVEVESQVGQGTCFVVRLPRDPREEASSLHGDEGRQLGDGGGEARLD